MVEQLRRRWPPDWTKLHVYFVPDPAEIKPLVDAYRSILDDLPFVARQPEEWLHATVMVVDHLPARDVAAQQRDELEGRLRQTLAATEAFKVTCGPAVVNRSSIALPMTPDGEFAAMIDRVRTAAGETFGQAAVGYSSGPPHITLGYATGDGDSDWVRSKLCDVTDVQATITVDRVRLVDVLVDRDLFQFRWDELAVLPLKR